MALQPFDALFKEAEVSSVAPHFYSRICSLLARRDLHPDENILDIALEEFDELSKSLDKTQIQESCSVRNVLKARLIATHLVREDGEIDFELAKKLSERIKANLYSLAPGCEPDAVRDEHIVEVLDLLVKEKELSRIIKHMSRPLTNRLAEEVIRDTLMIPVGTLVSDVHVRRACLAAWLTTLRQSLGSCFATAPAIIIHHEQPHLFLHDLDEMMNTGRMRRTFGGVEYTVPMSSTWGNGDLKKPIVLQRELEANESKIWMSPGLIAALEAVQVFEKAESSKEKVHKLHKLLKEALSQFSEAGPFIITTAEEILRVLLLQHHGIRQKDVDEYLNRPKSMIASGLMLHVPRTSKNAKTKGDPCVNFLKDIEIAKTAFKTLADCALLKSWEFTLASFSEIKLDFARFNLYASLGINYDDPGGIGECIYRIISLKIEQANSYLKEKEEEYEQIALQMQYLDARARSASTEKEIEWMKVEYRSRQADLYNIEQQRQIAYDKAKKIASLNEFLISEYDKKFRDYFQEVYDAEIHDISSNPFDDSPAGFRLIFQHGRTNPSMWTHISSVQEFVEALVSFFTITEQEFSSAPQIKGVEGDFSLIITQLVTHVRSDAFLESAFYRMARAHGAPLIAKPLQNLDKVEKKPWVYTSGGSMSTLVSAYYKSDEKPFEVTRWVENETELFAFLLDTLKHLPEKVTRPYLENPAKSMLIHSPTHAFLLKPGFPQFRDGWLSEMYTYSWIKHELIEPTQNFLKGLYIEEEMAHDIIKELLRYVPLDFRPRFLQVFEHPPYRLSVGNFFDYIVNACHSDRGLRIPHGTILSEDVITEVLYSLLPFTQVDTAKMKLQENLARIFANDRSRIGRVQILLEQFWKSGEQNYISSKQLIEIANAYAALVIGSTRCPTNMRRVIVEELRRANLVLPYPTIFADTNWVKDYFAFVVSPVTQELEFWSVDSLGVQGRPVSHWKMWLNGARRDPKWGIFSRPHDYVG